LAAYLAGSTALRAQTPPTVYRNDFEQAELGQAPGDLLVLDGQFKVQQDGGNKSLELPGAPLDTFGVLFGPSAKTGVAVRGRVFGTHQGRRFPVFSVSLGGVSGYRLQVAPAKKSLELLQGDTVKATAPFRWQSGTWTHLWLQVRQVGLGAWRVEGKAWAEGTTEPAAWTVSTAEEEEPVAGRAGIWGSPFSGTPIRFDDLVVTELKDPR
jgi:hypothetical protein